MDTQDARKTTGVNAKHLVRNKAILNKSQCKYDQYILPHNQNTNCPRTHSTWSYFKVVFSKVSKIIFTMRKHTARDTNIKGIRQGLLIVLRESFLMALDSQAITQSNDQNDIMQMASQKDIEVHKAGKSHQEKPSKTTQPDTPVQTHRNVRLSRSARGIPAGYSGHFDQFSKMNKRDMYEARRAEFLRLVKQSWVEKIKLR